MSSDQAKNIVVVGGGIIGSTTAYFLTRHPSYNPAKHTVTLIEPVGIASGASGKAGGLLALWAYPSCLVPLSFRLHAELAKEHGGESRWGYRRLGCGELAASGRVLGGKKEGKVADGKANTNKNGGIGALHKDHERDSSKLKKANASKGLPDDLDWFDSESVQYYSPMGDSSNTAQVHPYHFTTSMASLAKEKGAKIILGSVTQINSTANQVESVTYTPKDSGGSSATLPATDVIITAGPWTPTVFPSAPISHVRAHSVCITPSAPLSPYAIFTGIQLPKNYRGPHAKSRATSATPEIYARPNNEAYACGEADRLVPLPPTSADVECDMGRCQDIIDQVSSISDELRDGTVTVRQACYLPQVETGGGPLVGETGVRGVLMGAGHTCWGIQNGPGTGKVLSEFVFEGRSMSAKVGSLDPKRVM